MNAIDVVILAGGMGTRLRPSVSDRPKVLAPVAGRPFLSVLLDQISRAGLKRVILCTGYMAGQVEAEFGEEYNGLCLIYSRESTPLDTGGALRNASPVLSSKSIMVMNGDSFINIELNDFLLRFAGKGCDAAIVLTREDDTSRYGLVDVDPNGLITKFHEKETIGEAGWINAGVYLLERSVLGTIPKNKRFSLERELFPALAGRNLFGYCSEGEFIDIGLPSSYADAQGFFKKSYKR